MRLRSAGGCRRSGGLLERWGRCSAQCHHRAAEHTDALKPEHRQITHTVYEPGSFTPLVQLSTRGKEQTKQHALMLAVQGADDGDDEVNAQMAQMLAALPQDMRHLLDRSIRQAAREGLTAKLTPISAHQLSNTAHQANYPMDYLSRTLYTQP